MTSIYLHDWAQSCFFGMVADFEGVYISKDEYEASEAPYANVEYWLEKKAQMDVALAKPDYAGVEILLAAYECEGYEGSAFVLFRKDGKLYEVNGGHCSCYGLEEQWSPEKTTAEALRHRIAKGQLGDGYGMKFRDELLTVLAALEKQA